MTSFSIPRSIAIVLAGFVTSVVVAGVFVSTASNTVPETSTGEGTNTISGYAVSDPHYTLNTSNPSQIDAVAFDLDSTPPAGSAIRVRLVSSGSDWYSCTNSGVAVSCATTSPAASVASADELTVVVAQ